MESEAVAELILACIIFLDNQRVSIRMVNDATRHHLAIVLLRTFVQNHIHGVNNILKGRSKSMFCLVSRTHVSSLNLKKKKKKKGIYYKYGKFTHAIARSHADGQVLDAGNFNARLGLDNFVDPCPRFFRYGDSQVGPTDDGFEVVFLRVQGLPPAVDGMLLDS